VYAVVMRVIPVRRAASFILRRCWRFEFERVGMAVEDLLWLVEAFVDQLMMIMIVSLCSFRTRRWMCF
jgi:hypothetical protein